MILMRCKISRFWSADLHPMMVAGRAEGLEEHIPTNMLSVAFLDIVCLTMASRLVGEIEEKTLWYHDK